MALKKKTTRAKKPQTTNNVVKTEAFDEEEYKNFGLSPQSAKAITKYAAAKAKKAGKDVSSHKITDYFQVRRSSRKTSKQIEIEEMNALQNALETGSNEDFLDVYIDEVKGRGIRAKRPFSKGDFVIEYKGEMIDYSLAKKLEAKYATDEQIGSYMYFFTHNNKKWCVDATKETPWKGRLINHSAMRPNLKTKVVVFDGKHYLILLANKNIEAGEELLYDYGDRTADTVASNPWLINT